MKYSKDKMQLNPNTQFEIQFLFSLVIIISSISQLSKNYVNNFGESVGALFYLPLFLAVIQLIMLSLRYSYSKLFIYVPKKFERISNWSNLIFCLVIMSFSYIIFQYGLTLFIPNFTIQDFIIPFFNNTLLLIIIPIPLITISVIGGLIMMNILELSEWNKLNLDVYPDKLEIFDEYDEYDPIDFKIIIKNDFEKYKIVNINIKIPENVEFRINDKPYKNRFLEDNIKIDGKRRKQYIICPKHSDPESNILKDVIIELDHEKGKIIKHIKLLTKI